MKCMDVYLGSFTVLCKKPGMSGSLIIQCHSVVVMHSFHEEVTAPLAWTLNHSIDKHQRIYMLQKHSDLAIECP